MRRRNQFLAPRKQVSMLVESVKPEPQLLHQMTTFEVEQKLLSLTESTLLNEDLTLRINFVIWNLLNVP
ncbi:hypothetical protein JHK87_039053 [Glycine soja]|nr:hypothetical protein JHK87_039053 [Glycine soja]